MRDSGGVDIDVRQIGKRAVVKVEGEIDVASVPVLVESVDAAVSAGALEIWLDLGSAAFMDSTGLRAVLRVRRRLADLRRPLAIICPPGRVRRVFELAGVEHALPLYATLPAAQRQM